MRLFEHASIVFKETKSGQPIGRHKKPSTDSFQRIVLARQRDGP